MQTQIIKQYLETPKGQEADQILRTCVHCGFCTATCPTYQLLGDELDSPRGRIYLIKQMLEGHQVSEKTQTHLDRCLSCRSCETTCPSGVQYGKLIDIGRELVDQQTSRPLIEKLMRYALRKIIPYPQRYSKLLRLAHVIKPVLARSLKKKIPTVTSASTRPEQTHARRMLILEGCVQSVSTPQTSASTVHVLDRLGIQLITAEKAGCCGAVSHHLSAVNEGHEFMRRNIDAWWPYIQDGVEAIIVTASGCGVMVKDYGYLLKDDPAYADKACKVSELAKDISEIIQHENLEQLVINNQQKIAFHSPCTLQHGQKLNGLVESILSRLGFNLTEVADPHLCCGSAGTYSILQSKLSQQLLNNKLDSLNQGQPDIIATANVGCQMHMSTKSCVPVKHWIELISEGLE
ncbi:MAG: glycolate oxidase subunit GlcF [Gammaproteobacteria bacterium]|nr:glycolate oxidase subunit GlcF [Gammaproteobacteria bacterium]MCW9055929.1 glycolate oxidase subunit GlcF [Gammaproteobacteria bacterium]